MTARLIGLSIGIPKNLTFRSERLRKAVTELPCMCCGIEGRTQAAHTNYGKGGAIKASDARIMALCADSPGYVGCHSKVDARSDMTKLERRAFEDEMVALTYIALMECGLLEVAA